MEEKVLNLEKNILTGKIINDLTVDYAYKYRYYNNYVEKYENDDYLIYIYNNLNSLKNISNEATIIDFGDCYEKIKNVNQIEKDLIITTITIKENNNNNRYSTKYLFSNPITGEIIKNTSDICANDKIIMQENAMTLMNRFDKEKKEDIIFLTKQGIDVFNLSDRFYNDLCYFYKSPNNKDICMKDRISYFFPNISLCEPGCKNKGVNLDNLRVKCECIFNDFMDNELIGSELGQSLGEIVKIIDSLNIEVIKCIKYIFDNKRIKKCTGGLIFTCLFVLKIIFIICYLNNGMDKIKQYIFLLYESFNIYLGKIKVKNKMNFPPKKIETRSQIKSKSSIVNYKKINIIFYINII